MEIRKVYKQGNSYVVAIPREYLEFIKALPQRQVLIKLENPNRIVILGPDSIQEELQKQKGAL